MRRPRSAGLPTRREASPNNVPGRRPALQMKGDMSNVKLKIDLVNGLVELEGGEEFAKTELPKILELLDSKARKPSFVPQYGDTELRQDSGANQNSGGKTDFGAFIAKVKPDTNNEIVVTVAYFWAFVDKAHGAEFKNKEVVDLYTGPIRRSKPARYSNLCSDCASQTSWVRAGSKMGYWQISDEGQKWVDGKFKKSAEPTA
jgi:hypothetical protein